MPSHYSSFTPRACRYSGAYRLRKSTLLQLLTRARPQQGGAPCSTIFRYPVERIRLTPDYQCSGAAASTCSAPRCVIIYYWRRPMPATKPFRHAASSRRPRKTLEDSGLTAGSAKAVACYPAANFVAPAIARALLHDARCCWMSPPLRGWMRPNRERNAGITCRCMREKPS